MLTLCNKAVTLQPDCNWAAPNRTHLRSFQLLKYDTELQDSYLVRVEKDDTMPGPPSMPSQEQAAGTVPHENGARPGARRRRRIREVLTAVGGCAAAGSAGYALGGPVVAVAGLMAAVVVAAAVVVMLSAMIGGRDLRSPFERLMLIICVIAGRQPDDYLPPTGRYRPATSERIVTPGAPQ